MMYGDDALASPSASISSSTHTSSLQPAHSAVSISQTAAVNPTSTVIKPGTWAALVKSSNSSDKPSNVPMKQQNQQNRSIVNQNKSTEKPVEKSTDKSNVKSKPASIPCVPVADAVKTTTTIEEVPVTATSSKDINVDNNLESNIDFNNMSIDISEIIADSASNQVINSSVDSSVPPVSIEVLYCNSLLVFFP